MTDSYVSHIYLDWYVHDYPIDMFADDSGFTEWDTWMMTYVDATHDVTFSSVRVRR